MELLVLNDVALGRIIVGAILIGAGTLKLLARNYSNKDLQRFPLIKNLARVSLPMTKILVYSIFVVEIALGILFAFGYGVFLTGTMIIIMLGVFTVWVTSLFFKGEKISCGCFGGVSLKPVGKGTLLRNSVLIILATMSTFSIDISLGDLVSAFQIIPVPLLLMYIVPVASVSAVLLSLSSRINPFSVYANNIGIYGKPSVQDFAITFHGFSKWLSHRINDDKYTSDKAASEGSENSFAIRSRQAYRHQLKNYHFMTEQEKKASILVSKLDGLLSGGIENNYLDIKSIKDSVIAMENDSLKGIEQGINETLQKMYSEASKTKGSEKDKLLVRIALFHWTILVRRVSMRTFHTKVPGLQEDHDCQGDVISDQLLLHYFNTLFDPPRGIRSEIKAVKALSDLARQSACLGAQQSAWLASALYWSFVELRSFLRVNGLERLIPFVTLAGCAPLLLFYDVEKYRGLQSPLARWFIENRSSLIQGMATKRIPMIWQGLWLYDRRTGHLFGYRATSKPKDENEVDLMLFIESIVSRENLGKYECSFSEMISRGPGKIGYLCAGSSCADENVEDRDNLKRRFNLGLEDELLKFGICRDPGNSDSVGGRSQCGDGVSIGENKFAASHISCLTEQIINTGPQRGKKILRCFAEATGRCSNPVEKVTKELMEQAFAGVKVGRDCSIKESASSDELEKAKEDARKDYEDAVETAQYWLGVAAEKLTKERKEWDEATTKYNRGEITKEEEDAAKVEYDAAVEDFNEEQVKYTESLKEAAEERDRKIREAEQKAKSQTRCPPDAPECGSDDCTAMDQATRKTSECLEKELEFGDTTRPIERVPGNIDPSPIDGEENEWTKCIDSLFKKPDVPRKCWYLDCGGGYNTISEDSEECSCKESEDDNLDESKLSSMCSHIQCEEGIPTPSQFGCTCGEKDETSGAPPGPPPRSFDVPTAPRFSDVRGF
jgi:hypothetical protein